MTEITVDELREFAQANGFTPSDEDLERRIAAGPAVKAKNRTALLRGYFPEMQPSQLRETA